MRKTTAINGQQRMWMAAILSCILFCHTQGYAQPLRVFTEPLAPVHFEEDGVVKGIATEIVAAIFKEAGLEPLFEVYPWKRSYQMVLENNGTFIYTLNRTKLREAVFHWIGPILSKKTYLYRLRSRNDIEIANYDDVKKYTTAVILGHSLTTELLELGFREGKELIVTPEKSVQIKVFLSGRCDLITGNEYTIYQSLKSQGYLLSDVEPAFFISSGGYYLGANINTSEEIVERLQRANAKIQASGIVDVIVKKYMQ